jgi:hypothetical protein
LSSVSIPAAVSQNTVGRPEYEVTHSSLLRMQIDPNVAKSLSREVTVSTLLLFHSGLFEAELSSSPFRSLEET